MMFHEILLRERKRKELSQEALAGLINVSRQAVSKWETGDAMPDLPKLLALADALDLSLDSLCGRERSSSTSATLPSPAPRKTSAWLIATCILLFALLAGSLILLFSLSTPSAPPSLLSITEEFSVSGLTFHGKSSVQVAYQFTPSITGEGLTYQITFTNSEGKATTINAPCSGGLCAGQTNLLYGWQGYTVTISVTDGVLSRNLAVARGLTFSQGNASWTPIDP